MRLLFFLLVFYIHERIRGSAFNQNMQLNHLRAKRDDSMEDGLLQEDELPEDYLPDDSARQDDLTEEEKEEERRKALYSSDLFEGDIANPGFSKEFLEDLITAKQDEKANNDTRVQNNAIRDPYFRWPKVGDVVEIPFVLRDEFSYKQRVNIDEAIAHIRQKTCIRFVPKRSNHKDYIVIRNSKNVCSSFIGRIGGPQVMMLGRGCLYEFGTPVHEMMHALGFYHEQSRADRDDYVDIIWSNIEEEEKHNFKKYDLSYITHLETSYDYESIMHYDNRAFGIDGKITIVPTKRGVKIGQLRGLSSNDIYKINKMYDCLGAEPKPKSEHQLVPNCDGSCVESVKINQITQSNHECCNANGFKYAHGCYGLDNWHKGVAVCFKKKEPEPESEHQLVPNCDDSCVESVKIVQITQSNHECCNANGFTHAYGCYGLDNWHRGAAVCVKKKEYVDLALMRTQKGSDSQKWVYTPEGYIQSQLDGEVLDVLWGKQFINSSARVGLWPKNNGINQKWNINLDGTISSRLNGMVLDIPDANPAEGAVTIVYPRNGGANQKWKIELQTNGLQYSDKDVGIYGENHTVQQGQLPDSTNKGPSWSMKTFAIIFFLITPVSFTAIFTGL